MEPVAIPSDVEYARQYGFCGRLSLPSSLTPPYDVIHDLAQNAPGLLARGELAVEVRKLPLVEEPPKQGELELAKMAYSFLAQAFVWEPVMTGIGGPRLTVPGQLALPLVKISTALNEPPIYLYVDHTIRNSRLREDGMSPTMENLKAVYTFSGTEDEDRFVVVHTAYENIATPGIRTAIELAAGMSRSAAPDADMESIAETIVNMRNEFAKVRRAVDVETFRNKIRQYLTGWYNNVPGLRYEGIEIDASSLRGETGAGSSSLPLFDRFMSVMNEDDATLNPNLRTYFDFDRYRPRWHRAVLSWMSTATDTRRRALSGDVARTAYNRVIEEIAGLRVDHLRNIGVYLKGTSRSQSSDGIGTGGSNYASYLVHLAEHTQSQKITDNPRHAGTTCSDE